VNVACGVVIEAEASSQRFLQRDPGFLRAVR